MSKILGHPNGGHPSATQENGVRHRHEPALGTIPEARKQKPSEIRAKRKRTKEKGKRRAFGWGMGWTGEGWIEDKFRHFGEHVARNQIRTLLLDCLVMTNLFYPSLAIYLQKKFPPLHPPLPPAHNTHRYQPGGPDPRSSRKLLKEHPLSLLSTPILDSFFPYPPPLLPRLDWGGWWKHEHAEHGMDPNDNIWTAVRPLEEIDWLDEEIRIMRVGWADVGNVLDGFDGDQQREWIERDHILLRDLQDMAEHWEDEYEGQGCVRRTIAPERDSSRKEKYRDPCLILEPGQLFESDSNLRQKDTNATDESHRLYEGVSIPFHVPDEDVIKFEETWASKLATLSRKFDGEVFVEAKGPTRNRDATGDWLISLNETSEPHEPTEPTPLPDPSPIPSSPPNLVYLLYLIFFSIIGHQISNASKAHSRFGLAFSGCVQVTCSAVMSFSVLALFGWNGWGFGMGRTTLPTYILPFVIIIVGVENMSTLVRAVFSVSFTHSVPVRIGLALSKVGTEMAITSLSDLILLFVMWFLVNIKPVREFCVFAAVVIITDWFMIHTFFLTILSIDAQRLELADVLASKDATDVTGNQDQDPEQSKLSWKKIVSARTAKSGTIVALICCVGIISYMTERGIAPGTTASLYGYQPSSTTTMLRPTPTPLALSQTLSALQRFWQSLNPSGWPIIKVVIPAGSIIVLPRSGHSMIPADLRKLTVKPTRLLLPRLKPLFYLFKVVILPQAVTATALYGLLLYLLKDAELLDAQRNKLGRHQDSSGPQAGRDRSIVPLSEMMDVNMLPMTQSDVEIIKTSTDGKIVFSVGIDNQAHLWRFDDSDNGTREKIELPQEMRDLAVTSAAISKNGRSVAILYRTKVFIYEVAEDDFILKESLAMPKDRKALDVAFHEVQSSNNDPFISEDAKADSPPSLLVSCSGGTVLATDGKEFETAFSPGKSASPKSSSSLLLTNPAKATITLHTSENQLLLTSWLDSSWLSVELHSTRPGNDKITCHTAYQLSRDIYGDIIGIGYKSGLVEVFDCQSGTLLVSTQRPDSVESISLKTLGSSPCQTCDSPLPDGFLVITSTADRTQIDHIHPRSDLPFCRCVTVGGQRRPSDPVVHNPHSSLLIPPSNTDSSKPNASPKGSPGLGPAVNGDIPLSSHGMRRHSTLHREGTQEDRLAISPVASQMGQSWTDLEVTPLGAILTSQGGAVVLDDWIICLHRAGSSVDDSSYQIISINLHDVWNGSSLVLNGLENLANLHRKTIIKQTSQDISLSDQRAERLLSLSGKSKLTSLSISAGTSPGLAYVGVHPIAKRNGTSLIGGFGNRLGVLTFNQDAAAYLARLVEAQGGDNEKELEKRRKSGSEQTTPLGSTGVTRAIGNGLLGPPKMPISGKNSKKVV